MKNLFVVLSFTIVLSLLFTSCSKDDNNEPGGGEEKINVLDKITDSNFKKRIQTAIERGSIITASTDSLTPKEAAAVELLHVYSWGIKNLDGIEYFTGLKEFDCSNNKLESLDLSKNTKLEKLRCNECTLTSLDVSKNKELQSLQCWKNDIQSIDVSNCLKLTVFECYKNKITKLDVSKNKGLRYFDCNNCQISGTLDVSNCNLRVLRCSENYKITSIKLNNTIESVTCVLNDLSELDLSKCTNLLHVMCTRNPKMASLDISNNRTLKNVTCGGISSEPPITLYVWWDVDENNMWASKPADISVGVGVNGKMVKK